MGLDGRCGPGGQHREQRRRPWAWGRGCGGPGRAVSAGRGISGYAQHSHDVGIARARSPACHHDHQVPNVKEAMELS